MEAGFDRLHWLLDEAFADEEELALSDTFIAAVGDATGFASNPLFMVMQESIYGQGPSDWAAEREVAHHTDFVDSSRPLRFTGEMAFAWMAEEVRALRPYGMGWNLFVKQEWPAVFYDESVLLHNEVPVEAVVYFDDMYVPTELSLNTAKQVRNLRVWVTNEYEHDGIRMGNVVERLIERLENRLSERTHDAAQQNP